MPVKYIPGDGPLLPVNTFASVVNVVSIAVPYTLRPLLVCAPACMQAR